MIIEKNQNQNKLIYYLVKLIEINAKNGDVDQI